MSDLRNCPFCGSAAYDDEETWAVFGRRTGHKWAVACSFCEASSPGANSQGEAIAAWNRRAPAQGEEGEK